MAGLTTKQERFITAWQTLDSASAVAKELGLSVNSVNAQASKLRNPEFVKVQKQDSGDPVFRTVDGRETIDTQNAKTDSQGKPVRVLVYQKDGHDSKVIKREGIPLKKMMRDSGIDVAAATALIAKLASKNG